MKRQSLFELIKAHFEYDNKLFLKLSRQISREIRNSGDLELSKSLSKIIRRNTIANTSEFSDNTMIMNDYQKQMMKIIDFSIKRSLLSKIFIYGKPGTGKTLFVKILAKQIGWDLKVVYLSEIIHSKLGESMKELEKYFHKQ